MNGADKEDARELKERMYAKAHGRCKHCHKPVTLQGCHLAHKIPAHKKYIKKYGRAVIYHELNMDITDAQHNHLSLIDPASQPIKAAALLKKINEALNE